LEIVIQGTTYADPRAGAITLEPCGCTAGQGDVDFDQFVDVMRRCFGLH
jgi:hypothetical protein